MAASRPSSWNGWRATKWSCTRPTARACAACAWRWTSAWRQAPSSPWPWAWAPARLLYAYGTALLLICVLWVGATVMLAAWAVRRSMAPARRLSEQAARIQPDNLAPRLPLQDTDRELQDFVRSFNRTLDRLQSAYQQMEGFNADVAHELRTPLATLINGTQVMLSSPRDAAELRDALESNLEVLEDLKTMVNDMLFLARADRGERAADLSAISLAAEARRVAEYYDAALEERGIRLRCEGDAAVAANPGLVRRALANLISNAIKATPPATRSCCAASPSPAARAWKCATPAPPSPPPTCPASSTVSSARARAVPRAPKATAWAWPSSAPSPACTTATWTPAPPPAKP